MLDGLRKKSKTEIIDSKRSFFKNIGNIRSCLEKNHEKAFDGFVRMFHSTISSLLLCDKSLTLDELLEKIKILAPRSSENINKSSINNVDNILDCNCGNDASDKDKYLHSLILKNISEKLHLTEIEDVFSTINRMEYGGFYPEKVDIVEVVDKGEGIIKKMTEGIDFMDKLKPSNILGKLKSSLSEKR